MSDLINTTQPGSETNQVNPTTVEQPTPVDTTSPDSAESDAAPLTQTERLYEALKLSLTTILGKKLVGGKMSRKMASYIMREVFDTIVQFTADEPTLKVPVIGVGRFYINMSKARQFPNKPSAFASLEKIPHVRWKPSSRFFSFLVEKMCGVKVSGNKPVQE